MSAHTPGPWSSGKDLPLSAMDLEAEGVSMTFVNAGRGQETRANARLIATALEILECLIQVTERLAWLNSDDDAHIMEETDRAKKIISKATGEQE